MASSFLGELRIVADLERARQVRLQTMPMPDSPHALFAEASGLGHAAGAPVGGIAGFLLRRFPDHFLDFGRRDRRRSSWPWRVLVQRRQTAVQKPLPPACGLLRHDSQLGCDLLVLHPGRGQQDNSRALHAPRRSAPSTSPRFQEVSLLGTQHNGSRHTHRLCSFHCRDDATAILVTI